MANTFYPIVAGRVTDSLNRARSLSQLQSDQISIARLQNQLSTGVRINRPSDDPAAAIRILALQRQQENQSQSIVNLETSDSYLSVTATSLGSLSDTLQQVKGIALEAVTNLNTDADRQSLAIQLDDQLGRLLSLGNQEFQDRFLFAGGRVRTQPFAYANDGIEFRGNHMQLDTVGLDSTLVSHNVGSTAAFASPSQGVVGLTDLNPTISNNTLLRDLNGRTGTTEGAIQFSDGVEIVQVDLAGSHRVSDILQKINATEVSGRQLSATLTSNGIRIDYADAGGGVLRISNVGSGSIASELGIETTTPAPGLPITGTDLRPAMTLQTPLANLMGGAGLSPNGGIKISQGDRTFDISFAGTTTVEDVLLKINNSGAKVKASIAPDGRRLQIESTLAGLDYSISELNSDTASVLGIKTLHGNVRLSELNHGQGVFGSDGNDLVFQRTDGTTFNVDISSAVTIGDVVSIINSHPDNQVADLRITASLNNVGNGLQLSAPEPVLPAVGSPIVVRNAGGSQAGYGLGLIPRDQTATTATLNAGTYSISGADPNPQEVKSVFNTVLRLRKAILEDDPGSLERLAAELDEDLSRIGLVRGQIGVEQQRIDSLKIANEDQIVQAKADQSLLLDTDYAEAIAEFTSRQTAYEASLQLLANVMKGANLFNFI